MKQFLIAHKRIIALVGMLIPLLVLFIYVAIRSGPLASVAVTVASVQEQSIEPAVFGIGIVEARYTNKIGPTFTGRVKRLDVHVGDLVKAGQVLGEMDPIDFDDRIRSQEALLKRAEAMLRETKVRQAYAQTQAQRYEKLLTTRSVSEEAVVTKQQELQVANAALLGAREDIARIRADHAAVITQRDNLRLVAPVDGLVTMRNVDPGTIVVAGQPVVEIIDTNSLWIDVRFDQISSAGLEAELVAQIVLRSRSEQALLGHVLRVEPLADAVTEETLAKVTFDNLPSPLPPVGELAEVTVILPKLSATPVIPNAAIHRVNEKLGVWQIIDGDIRFTPVQLGVGNLDGYMQVRQGLKTGDQIIVYSEKTLTTFSRIHEVKNLSGATK
jgi:HlyD family secretion protein